MERRGPTTMRVCAPRRRPDASEHRRPVDLEHRLVGTTEAPGRAAGQHDRVEPHAPIMPVDDARASCGISSRLGARVVGPGCSEDRGGAVTLAASPYLARISRTSPTETTPVGGGTTPTKRRSAITAVIGSFLAPVAGYAAGWSAALPAFLAFACCDASRARRREVIGCRSTRRAGSGVRPGTARRCGSVAWATGRHWAGPSPGVPSCSRCSSWSRAGLASSMDSATSSSPGHRGLPRLAGLGPRVYGVFRRVRARRRRGDGELASRRASLKSALRSSALIAGALLVAAVH